MASQKICRISMFPNFSYGMLAHEYVGKLLPLQVLTSANGFYIGTIDEDGPCSRESLEYFDDEKSANQALASGNWTQKGTP